MTQKTPYIGSTISLISKLDIRYEGVLYNVNSVESTIALANVRAFGTEDRPTTNPVLARDKTYDYIIFKATDIKDLVVCETPKPSVAQPRGLPYDPAIVSFAASGPNESQKDSTVNNNPNSLRLNKRNGGFPQNQAFYPKPDYGNFYPARRRNCSDNNLRCNRNQHFRPPTQNPNRLKFESDYDFEKANEQFKETLESLGIKLDRHRIEVKEEKDDEKEGSHEEDIEMGESAVNTDVYYDKSSSFFDSISCETQDKIDSKSNRLDWKKERQTNQETFGHSAVRSLNYRRGPRGYGFNSSNRFQRPQYRYTINTGGDGSRGVNVASASP